MEMSKGPLAGVTVFDLTRVPARPSMTMLWADMAAPVAKKAGGRADASQRPAGGRPQNVLTTVVGGNAERGDARIARAAMAGVQAKEFG